MSLRRKLLRSDLPQAHTLREPAAELGPEARPLGLQPVTRLLGRNTQGDDFSDDSRRGGKMLMEENLKGGSPGTQVTARL